jgi:hypothetical protein
MGQETNGRYFQPASTPSASPTPSAPPAPSTPAAAPRTGEGGGAAYIHRLGDG